jgi:hypothetical protein
MMPACVLSVTQSNGDDFLYLEDGKAPTWDHYRQAYDYAAQHGISPAIVWEFRSIEHAQDRFGNIFIHGGTKGAYSYEKSRATNPN